MSTTKVTDAMIDGVAASKLTGALPAISGASLTALPATLPASSGVNLTALNATNLGSGTVASARLGTGTASSSTVLYGDGTYKAEPVTDTTSLTNDIIKLALQTAINGNLTAHGLSNSWVEQFENSTYIENLSSVERQTTSEFIGSMIPQDSFIPEEAHWEGDTGSYTHTGAGAFTIQSGDNGLRLISDYNISGDFEFSATMTDPNGQVNFGVYAVSEDGTWNSTNGEGGLQNMTASWWYKSGQNYYRYGSSTKTSHNYASGSVMTLARVGSTFTSKDDGSTIQTWSETSSVPVRLTLFQDGSISGASYANILLKTGTSLTNASGSFNSTDVTPTGGASKSSVGLVVMYKDNGSSSCTLNTDVIAKVRANTGQAYQTLVLASDGTYGAMKIAKAPAIAVTAGTALSYEISFANQSEGSKEAHIYGIAMTY